jgi:hypothetical protein
MCKCLCACSSINSSLPPPVFRTFPPFEFEQRGIDETTSRLRNRELNDRMKTNKASGDRGTGQEHTTRDQEKERQYNRHIMRVHGSRRQALSDGRPRCILERERAKKLGSDSMITPTIKVPSIYEKISIGSRVADVTDDERKSEDSKVPKCSKHKILCSLPPKGKDVLLLPTCPANMFRRRCVQGCRPGCMQP